jgi:DNA-binding FadR family transcriptional regulator
VIARELATYIVDHDLPEGTRLPPETQMLETFDVGRTTIREALRLLETRGVLVIRSGRQGGPVVRRPRPDDLGEALSLILEFERSSLQDVSEARLAIEPTLARLAATHIDPTQLQQLKETLTVLEDHPNDHTAFVRANQAFHSTIAEASCNTVLHVFGDSLKSVADGVKAGVRYSPARRRAVIEAHAHILEALESGDPDAADRAMRAHLEQTEKFWRQKHTSLWGSTVRWTE